MRARFITFEGGEGAGKTTLIERVYTYLKAEGEKVVRTRAPGGTAVGAEIRRLLLDTPHPALSPRCELFLFLADRAQHVDEVIRPALEREEMVLCDRFNDSTLAYQGTRGFEKQMLERFLYFACDDLLPDVTFYLDCDPEIGFCRTRASRIGKDRIESEDLAFHRAIRTAFLQIAEREPIRFVVIDAMLSQDQVFELAKKKIDALLAYPRQ
jgi:dTMP kinase